MWSCSRFFVCRGDGAQLIEATEGSDDLVKLALKALDFLNFRAGCGIFE